MSADNVPLLSFNGNIGAGGDVYTEKVITGQYNSLNIIVKSDVNLQVTTEFSGDGTYWDYSIATNVAASTNKSIVTTVQAKWVRLHITNTGAVDSSFVRLFTYGTPTNSSILAQLANVGNKHPVVDIGNLPTNFAPASTIQEYKFIAGPTAATNTTFYSLYPNLYLSHTGASAVPTYGYTNQCLTLSTNNAVTLDDILDTPMVIGTNAASVIFSAKFVKNTDSSLGGIAVVGCGSNFGDRLAIGYVSNDSVFSYDDWGIYLAPAGAFAFISRANFNIDPCDGTVVVPVLDMTQFHTFQFIITQFSIDLYIQYESQFTLLNKYAYNSSTTPMFRDNSLGYFMRTNISAGSVATTGNLSVSCSEWFLQRYGVTDNLPSQIISKIVNYQTSGTILSDTVERFGFMLRNSTLYQGASCSRTVQLSIFSFYSDRGDTSVVFKLYKSPTYSVAPTTTTINNYTNVLVNSSTPTVSSYGTFLHSVVRTQYNLSPNTPNILIEIRAGEDFIVSTTGYGVVGTTGWYVNLSIV